jgi:uncharacterized protein YPO0396
MYQKPTGNYSMIEPNTNSGAKISIILIVQVFFLKKKKKKKNYTLYFSRT